ncbi:MAG: BACON domain-containing protein [Bacteroidales bacterium]|nr:BACON domain-containing protein [Bacteroidales bacterium]
MKTTIIEAIELLIAIIALTACQDDDIILPRKSAEHHVEMIQTNKGQCMEYDFHTTDEWIVSCDAKWCKVKVIKNSSDNFTLQVNIDDNTNSEPRSAYITVRNPDSREVIIDVTIYQNQNERSLYGEQTE